MDERQPLLNNGTNLDKPALNPYPASDLVDFNRDGDPEDPIGWPSAYKWTIVTLLACMAFAT